MRRRNDNPNGEKQAAGVRCLGNSTGNETDNSMIRRQNGLVILPAFSGHSVLPQRRRARMARNAAFAGVVSHTGHVWHGGPHKAISGGANGHLLCKCAMRCCAIGALASENDIAGFELPIRKAKFD